MSLTRVELENFRNFKSLDIGVAQGFSVLMGENGAGKSNFLEGIYNGCSMRRFPESKFSQLFQWGESYFRLILHTNVKELKVQEFFCQNLEGRYQYEIKLNNQQISRLKYCGVTPAISFLPQDLTLLTRSPGDRRRFLNEVLINTSLMYRSALRNYARALKQRNILWEKIKSGEKSMAELFVWNEPLAEFGSIVIKERGDFIEYLNSEMPKILDGLAPELQQIKFFYKKSGSETKEQFLEKLKEMEEEEKKTGVSLMGPQRDDFYATLENLEIVGYFSRGQMRSIVLALKIAEGKFIENALGQYPIYLLDDVLSEFDLVHQERLISFLRGFKQIFITTTRFKEIQKFLVGEDVVFYVDKGRIGKNV